MVSVRSCEARRRGTNLERHLALALALATLHFATHNELVLFPGLGELALRLVETSELVVCEPHEVLVMANVCRVL